MTENKTFEPITSQEEFNERIKARLAREREKWEKESGVEELRAQLAAKDEEIASIRREHWRENTERLIRERLASKGVTDDGRINRVMKLVDFDAIAEANRVDFGVDLQLQGISRDIPQLLEPARFVPSPKGRSDRPLMTHGEKPLRREDVERMSEDEVNSRWDQVKAFLAGERS